jgi:hypothetical protein
MTGLRSTLAHRRAAAGRHREERALRRAIAAAPTVESAHEIASLIAHG